MFGLGLSMDESAQAAAIFSSAPCCTKRQDLFAVQPWEGISAPSSIPPRPKVGAQGKFPARSYRRLAFQNAPSLAAL